MSEPAEVRTLEPANVAPLATATPMALLSMAVAQGAPLDQMERLMALQERWEANEARKAFVQAMTTFKRNPPSIVKDKLVSFGQTKYKHAELDQVSGVIGKALSEVGISHRWVTEQNDGRIRVTCVLTHELGHSESVTLEAPPDTSGQKNSIQGIASAVTYLERYTLLAATGVATGEDTDGRAPAMPEEEFQAWMGKIKASKDQPELKKNWMDAMGKAGNDQVTKKALIDAKDERLAALRKVAK